MDFGIEDVEVDVIVECVVVHQCFHFSTLYPLPFISLTI